MVSDEYKIGPLTTSWDEKSARGAVLIKGGEVLKWEDNCSFHNICIQLKTASHGKNSLEKHSRKQVVKGS